LTKIDAATKGDLMNKKIVISAALLVVILAGVLYWVTLPKETTPPKALGPVKLTGTGGPVGGTWYGLTAVMGDIIKASIPGSEVTVVPGGGIVNPVRMSEGTADFGPTGVFPLKNAITGEPIFGVKVYDKKLNVRAILQFAELNALYFFVTEDSGITSIDQIKEKKYPLRLCVGTEMTQTEFVARMVLDAYGMSYNDIKSWGGKVTFASFAEIVTLIRDGQGDCYIGDHQVATPAGFITEIFTARKMRMLPLKEEVIKSIAQEGLFWRSVIKAGMYPGQNTDVPTIGETVIVGCRADLPNDVVYAVTKALVENKSKLAAYSTAFDIDPKTAWQIPPGMLHPGAEKYFRDLGYMK